MPETIAGMMFAKNEADILRETMTDAMRHVDVLYVADDGSTDGTWAVISDVAEAFKGRVFPQRKPDALDPGQRSSLLRAIKKNHRAEDTWVQVVEADVFLLDTDLRAAIAKHKVSDLAVSWQTLNGVRPKGTWKGVDTYPTWTAPIREILPVCHFMEVMIYTFRPLEKLDYKPIFWRPWPQGWTQYTKDPVERRRKEADSPLLLHVGYRGPTHFYQKYKSMGKRHRRYSTWDLTSVAKVEETVSFFDGSWNGHPFPASRAGWQLWVEARREGCQGRG